MDINYKLVFIASIVQFILGAIWYSPMLFGKLWMQIMECTHLSKEELKKMQKEMMPFYALQLFLTFFMTVSLAGLAPYMPEFSLYHIGFWIWIGFVVPTQVGSVIWANTKKKYWLKQIFIMSGFAFVAVMVAAFILSA